MFEWVKVLLLSIVQGIGEFLPISSSGHLLVLGKLLFGDTDSLEDSHLLTFNVLLHAGTLLAILLVFYRTIIETLRSNRRLIGLILVASIPAVIVGLSIKIFYEPVLTSLWVAGFGFLGTAILLLRVKSCPKESAEKKAKTLYTMSMKEALFIGCFQAIAVLPGFSRSGFTIGAALLGNMKREEAASFSFLLAIPVIAGATALEVGELVADGAFGNNSEILLSLFGMAVSFLVGLLSLFFLLKGVKKGLLHYFSYWLFPMGIAVLIWAILG